MPPKESFYPADWLRIAEKDWGRVANLLSLHDAEAAGLYLQQALEKFLKTFVLSKGASLKRIPDLEALLNQALKFDPLLETYRGVCQKITGFYMVEHYPYAGESGLTEDDIRQCSEQVKDLVERLRAAVVPPAP
jgi:HEPN domain-containing protein